MSCNIIMPRTYSDEKNIYSVDMMFAYVNNFKPKVISIPIRNILFNLSFKGWGNPKTHELYSPMDVIMNPKKYPDEIKRIKNSDLKYPIMVHNDYIVDGVHRTIKAMLNGQDSIKAYSFSNKLMKKFLVDSTGDWKTVDKMEIYKLIDLFYKRFMKK